MKKGKGKITFACMGNAARPQSLETCVACIQSCGTARQALSNVEKMMAGPGGEAVGLNLDSAEAVRQWISSVDAFRCHCF